MADGAGGRTTWAERYHGGSPEAERRSFKRLADAVLDLQLAARRRTRRIERAVFPTSVAAFGGARLRFSPSLPEDLRAGFVRPEAEYQVQVRFSRTHDDAGPRGLAIRIHVSHEEQHDLIGGDWPVSHGRDAEQYVRLARAAARSPLVGAVELAATVGPGEALRMLRSRREARRRCESVALETYWSCGAIRWGGTAVRYALFPGAEAAPPAASRGPDRLAREFEERLRHGDVTFELYLQRFVDEPSTPIEDASRDWPASVSPQVHAATLTLPRRDLTEPDALAERRRIDAAGFNPWNTTDEFRPLGNINRARKLAYDASSAHRTGRRWRSPPVPLRNRVLGGAVRWSLRGVNRRIAWHRLPPLLSLLNLDALRHDLRRWNLIDAEPHEAPPKARTVPPEPRPEERLWRTYDGRANDLSDPQMGAVGAAFGRNMRLETMPPDAPNAVLVARELLDRKTFIPARPLNVLAAAWIQFQVHDWVAHARRHPGEHDVVVPIPAGYPDWASQAGGAPTRQMRISGNVPHPRKRDTWTFGNATSHWWDGSEVYGSDAAHARLLRDGAKLRLTQDGYLPTDIHGQEVTGFNESWWMGLSAMHTLFAREHNVLVDELRRAYPSWGDERTYQTARLIVSALIAKIHTLEWTPAILGTEALDIAMRTNWYGPPSGDWLVRLGLWLTDVQALRGIPETVPDHHAVPFALTEEFATVYRMHPLIPDDYVFHDHATGAVRERRGFLDIQGDRADEHMRRIGLRDALYSFGIAHPGAITLHNFPKALQHFERGGEIVDLSVVDIVRTRLRRVPRYNGFRRALRMPEVRDWARLTPDAETNRLCREIYGRLENVDTVVGLLGEAPPEGFGFSDTAFRIFILMASRRLQSDRFLTVDFRPDVYSPLGMDWIERNTMTSVILRHFPELAPALPRGATAFAPWRQAG